MIFASASTLVLVLVLPLLALVSGSRPATASAYVYGIPSEHELRFFHPPRSAAQGDSLSLMAPTPTAPHPDLVDKERLERITRRSGPPVRPVANVLGDILEEHQYRWADAVTAASRILTSHRGRELPAAEVERMRALLGRARSWREAMEVIEREMAMAARERNPLGPAPGAGALPH